MLDEAASRTDEGDVVRADTDLSPRATSKIQNLIQRLQGGERLDFKVRCRSGDPAHGSALVLTGQDRSGTCGYRRLSLMAGVQV